MHSAVIMEAQSLFAAPIDAAARQQFAIIRASQNDHLRETLGPLTAAAKHTAIVLDIEGTTTPLPFVTKVLYPAAVARYESFLTEGFPKDAKVAEFVKMAAAAEKNTVAPRYAAWEAAKSEAARQSLISGLVAHLKDLTQRNVKAQYLKGLQGLIWRGGYEDGSIKGHLFDDAARNIVKWASLPDVSVHIYSSGSVAAQKLLFKYSSHGDLTPQLSSYSDTVTAGMKFEKDSYWRVKEAAQKATGVNMGDTHFVFLTDNLKEVAAAEKAKMSTVLLMRPLNAPLEAMQIPDSMLSACSFDQLGEILGSAEALRMSAECQRYREGSNGPLKSFL